MLFKDESSYVSLCTDSWAVAKGLAMWSGRRTMETQPLKGMPPGGMVPWKSLWELEGCVKVGHISAHQQNLPPGSGHVLN